jgi:hypothetical protein
VKATSADNSTAIKQFTVNVTDVDEFDVAFNAQADGNAAANVVDFNAVVGTAVGITAAAADADATNSGITYSLVDAAGAAYAGGEFAVDAATGVVTVAGVINRELGATRDIFVKATSADNSTAIQQFTVNLATFTVAAGQQTSLTADLLGNLIALGVQFGGAGVLNVTGYNDHAINSANISNDLDIRVALAAGTNHVLDAADATRLAQADRLVISNGQALTINADQLATLAELKGIVGTAGGDAESVTIADGAATTIDLKRISTIDNIDSFKVIGDAGANVIQLSTALSVSGKASVYLSGLDGANPNFATDGQVDKLIFNLTKDQGFGLDAGVYRTEGTITFNKVYGFTAGSDDFGIFYGTTNAISRFSTTTSEVGALVGTLVEDAAGAFMDSSSVTELSTLRTSIAAVVASTALDATGYGRFTGLSYSGQSTADADKSAAFLYAVEVQGTAAETAAQSISNLTTSSKFGVATLAEIVSIADTALSNVDITSKPAGLS